MTLNQEFMDDAVEFMRKYALNAGALEYRYRPLQQQDEIFSYDLTKRYTGKTGMRLGGDTPVGIMEYSYDPVLRYYNFVKDNEEGCGVTLVKANQGDQHTVPVYYLPWKNLGVTTMTLPEDLESDFFITAGLSGCSVFVRGNATNPTVFHAGVEGKSKYDAPDLWRACMRKLSVDHPTPRFYGIDKYEYMKTQNGSGAALLGRLWTTVFGSRHGDAFANPRYLMGFR